MRFINLTRKIARWTCSSVRGSNEPSKPIKIKKIHSRLIKRYMNQDWTASFSIRFRNGTCIIIVDKNYNIANTSCHFGSYGSIWTGPSPKKYYMDLRSFGPYNIFGDGPLHILPYDPQCHELFAIYWPVNILVYYIMILFKQFYWPSCSHLTFRKIWYCLIKTRIDSLSLSLSIALCMTS